jgi:hypothetical protein
MCGNYEIIHLNVIVDNELYDVLCNISHNVSRDSYVYVRRAAEKEDKL